MRNNALSVFLMFAASCSLTALAQKENCDSIDFWSVIKQVETNYAGFPTMVTSENHDDYESMKTKLFNQITSGERKGYDAACEYLAWFKDYHLSSPYSQKYLSYPDYSSIEYSPKFVSSQVDQDTYLLRVPTFRGDSVVIEQIKKGVEDYNNSKYKNLIIDLRGNTGGVDYSFDPLLEIIYSHPFTIDGAEILATPEISKFIRDTYIEQGHIPEWAPVVADLIDEGKSQFVSIPEVGDKEIVFDTIYQLPKKVALIIDGYVASSAEQFIIESVASSDKVTLYGKDNTMGAVDFGNLRRFDMACSCLTIFIPTTRSKRLSRGISYDRKGIEPDVRLDLPLPRQLTDNIDEWVIWVARQMKQ